MRIRNITFTGTDERIRHRDIAGISEECRQVEWGILFSQSRAGSPRYPGWSWIEDLIGEYPDLPLAAHFCGRYVRDLIAGDFHHLEQPWAKSFRRIQINFHGIKVAQADALLEGLSRRDVGHEFVLQMDGVNDDIYWAAKAGAVRVFPFFDRSGGEGVTPPTWPEPVGDYCGYAGGLGPHNLAEQVEKLARVVGEGAIWIDMESGIRNDRDEFDLTKVWECVQIARPYLSRE